MARKIVLGIFPKSHDADDALFHLKDAGFKSGEMSIIAREGILSKYQSDSDTLATVAGGILGGLTGLLIAITPVVIPGLGAVVIAGPLTALTGFLMGAVTGGLIGALIDLGLSEDQAKSYEKAVQKGGVLLSVIVSDQSDSKVRSILRDHNAEEIAVVPYSERVKRQKEQVDTPAFASEVIRKRSSK